MISLQPKGSCRLNARWVDSRLFVLHLGHVAALPKTQRPASLRADLDDLCRPDRGFSKALPSGRESASITMCLGQDALRWMIQFLPIRSCAPPQGGVRNGGEAPVQSLAQRTRCCAIVTPPGIAPTTAAQSACPFLFAKLVSGTRSAPSCSGRVGRRTRRATRRGAARRAFSLCSLGFSRSLPQGRTKRVEVCSRDTEVRIQSSRD